MTDEWIPVRVQISKDQDKLFKQRLYAENQEISRVLRALINAYIIGDLSVTDRGQYYLSPPKRGLPVIEVENAGELVEVVPDWGIGHKKDRPYRDTNPSVDIPEVKDTNWLLKQIREHTGRKIPMLYLRKLLAYLEIPKTKNKWRFDKIDSKYVDIVLEAIQDGTYDEQIRDPDIARLGVISKKRDEEEKELRNSNKKSERAERIQKLKKLREASE